MSEPKVSDIEIARTLLDTNANFAATANALTTKLGFRVTRRYVSSRISASARLQELVEEVRQTLLDYAEANIFRSVMAGNVEDSKFVLTTIGRERGWVRTTVIEDTDAAALARRIQEARAAKQAELKQLPAPANVVELKPKTNGSEPEVVRPKSASVH